MPKLNYTPPQNTCILGYGVEGQSLVDFFLRYGAQDLTVLDEHLPPEKTKELQSRGVTVEVGPFSDLSRFSVVFRSPSILPTRPELDSARQISSLTQLFLELCPTPHTIGITGTKGKGTTSTLIFRLLEANNKRTHLGGNIGTPPLDFIEDIRAGDYVILELSSFQTMDLTISPNLAVILMTTSEHLDVHSGVGEYVMAKSNLIRSQQSGEVCVYNSSYPNSTQIALWGGGQQIPFTTANLKKSFPNLTPGLRGPHNLENLAAAHTVAELLQIPKPTQKKIFETFTGLPHRLEILGEFSGITYVNDSFSTTPETALAALQSFPEHPILWLAGGSPKGSNFTIFSQLSSLTNLKKAILFGPEATKIKKYLPSSTQVTDLGPTPTRDHIWQTIQKTAQKNDLVLLSPGCASFGIFSNYKDRGNWLKKSIQSLQKNI